MCGIAGIFDPVNALNKNDLKLVKRMNKIQKHRGPDDEGVSVSPNCILGHRRLSIIDLSDAGHQPFHSHDNRYHLTFNGEIYNYIELRNELICLGWTFETKTDTEVLLKAYQEFGKDCLHKFNGMFAFAIYDSKENKLFLARDRIGIKPFYYTIFDSKLYFASEIKALRLIKDINFNINKQSLFDYLCFNRTDIFDTTFISEIKRLPKGYCYEIDAKYNFELNQWWNSENFLNAPNEDSEEDIYKKIEDLLVSSVKVRMRSDVVVGSCLSGGLDSSILTGIISNYFQNGNNFKTFTASFPNYAIDETEYVSKLIQKYHFENYKIYPDLDDAIKKFPQLVYYFDEPTSIGPSAYAQFEVMRSAKQHGVTVLIDGQGGDENFAGYQYFHGFNLTQLFAQKKITKLISELYKTIKRKQEKEAWQTFIFQNLPALLKKKLLHKTLPYIEPDFFYHYIDKSLIFNHFFTAKDLNTSLVRHFQYKLEHLLRVEDRNSMALSMETRVPYLDNNLIEYSLSILSKYKIKNGENKLLQKNAVGKYTIPEILERKDKIGFSTPTNDWMNNPIWHKFTSDSYDHLKDNFPEIFKKKAALPIKNSEHWKLNQLSLWVDSL